MDYKKIIKSRKARLFILRLLAFIPDKQMIRLQYRIKLHRRLNLKEPSRFTEKLQWYKLYYHDPLMRRCVDKYEVRGYVTDCGLENILVPIFGIYDNASDVDFSVLPRQFVIKDTLGGGGSSVIICRDKERLNIKKIAEEMERWTKCPLSYKQGGREWPYGERKHRILIEEFLPADEEKGGLVDYKFFCFYGESKYLYVIADRKVGEGAGVGIYEAKTFKRLDVHRCDEKILSREIRKPAVYDDMLKIAGVLSEPFPEARVDLYCVENRIYFGEITFYDGSGYMGFEPDAFDYEMGNEFDLKRIKRKNGRCVYGSK